MAVDMLTSRRGKKLASAADVPVEPLVSAEPILLSETHPADGAVTAEAIAEPAPAVPTTTTDAEAKTSAPT